MQMGCIMRPYFRGGARIFLREVSSKIQQVVLCEGEARMYVQHFATVGTRVKECDGTHSEYCARRVPTLRIERNT